MNKLLLFAVALLITLNVAGQKYSDSTNIIGEGHVGKIVINMNEQKLSSLFSADQIKTDKISEEGDEYSEFHITLKGESKESLELETMCMDVCLISRINVFSPKYKTIKGIGIGSEIGDLFKNYKVTTIVGGDKGVMVFIEEIPQTAFIINIPGFKAAPGKPVKQSEIPVQTKIDCIYMF